MTGDLVVIKTLLLTLLSETSLLNNLYKRATNRAGYFLLLLS